MVDVEQTLSEMWSDLLECGAVTEESDFFECGGTSVTAVHLAALIQDQFGVTFDAVEVVVERKFGKMTDLLTLRCAALS
ncbi:hypothetical protein GCM10022254_06190 [Actinomadura meridiana]|uniref:Carrier domain-containing protein n=2 Tax=Actinomadura meridiana TaxID=559626 RepID=A0ABP8BST4_9ACTN